jgi:hypothetical protein
MVWILVRSEDQSQRDQDDEELAGGPGGGKGAHLIEGLSRILLALQTLSLLVRCLFFLYCLSHFSSS